MSGQDQPPESWLRLGEASRRLGVDPDTLRRWSDQGKIEVFTTPGGHRRFLRSAIDALLPRPRQAQHHSLSSLGETPDRVAEEFRRQVQTDMPDQGWHNRLDEDALRWFRDRGMRMSALLLGTLDTTGHHGREQLLAQAEALGREYGAETSRRGLSLGEATQAFLFFRARFMGEIAAIARRRSLASDQASELFGEADRTLDRVIVAFIQAHQSGA